MVEGGCDVIVDAFGGGGIEDGDGDVIDDQMGKGRRIDARTETNRLQRMPLRRVGSWNMKNGTAVVDDKLTLASLTLRKPCLGQVVLQNQSSWSVGVLVRLTS